MYRNGKVEVLVQSRRNGRLGTFEMILSPTRLAELRRAVKRAGLPEMQDSYPEEVSMTAVTISIDDPELGRKRVTAYSGEGYPSDLRPLFDDSPDGRVGPDPGGLLSRLIGDATAHPLAAITVQIGTPKGALRAREPFTPELVVKNIGRNAVIVPSFDCKEIVSGYASVTLRHDPPPVGQRDAVVDGTYMQFGPRLLGYHETLDDAGAADLQHIVRIKPGKEWRIRMPKALVAPTPGRYRLDAQFWANLLYKRAALTERLGPGFVSGWIFPESVSITVSK